MQQIKALCRFEAGDEVSVWVPLPINSAYSYRLQSGQTAFVGSLVKVQVSSRELYGIVIASASSRNFSKSLRPIKEVLDIGLLASENPTSSYDFQPSPPAGSIINVNARPIFKPAFLRFLESFSRYTLTPIGLVVEMVLRGAGGALSLVFNNYLISKGGRGADALTPLTAARSRVLTQFDSKPLWSKADLLKHSKVSSSVIEAMLAKDLLVKVEQSFVESPFQAEIYRKSLNADQLSAAKVLAGAVEDSRYKSFLLEGVTGSGKTEVYFAAVEKALCLNRQILLLMPEIGLTQQFVERFARRFGFSPLQWHYGLTKGQRQKIWRWVAEHRARVIVGTRSSLFLPFNDLGLIIVDEEHDVAYKQEAKVFYNARDMAVLRASIEAIPVILASATPSIESQVNVARGKYSYLELPKRIGKSTLPHLSAIDLRVAPPPAGRFLSPVLVEAMHEAISRGEQSLLFLNRRGYAPITLCRSCGYRFGCQHCSSYLVYHQSKESLLCHHCGYRQAVDRLCPACSSEDSLLNYGPGVERIAEEVHELFPAARHLVLSTDLQSRPSHAKLALDKILTAEVDVIIGTQLIAKGHNFPLLTLVGVVDTDASLGLQDFRAAERTFQQLLQVTGRAGRAGLSSYGLLQSWSPENVVLQALLSGDKAAFFDQEIKSRCAGNLPPFGKLIALIIASEQAELAENYAQRLRQAAPDDSDQVRVFGPAAAPLALLRDKYRFRLLLHGVGGFDLQEYARHMLRRAGKAPNKVDLQIDVDPISFF